MEEGKEYLCKFSAQYPPPERQHGTYPVGIGMPCSAAERNVYKMSKPVCITTDSTCDLPPEILERFQIHVIPLHVILGDEVYLDDGKAITPEIIYNRYAKDKTLPHTAAVSPQEFINFFTPLVEAGYEVVHLDLSSELSGTSQNAIMVAEDLPGVYAIDSRQLTTGMGQMALAACRMRDEGMDAAAIAQGMIDLIPKVDTSFVLDTLEYMWKGGRCTGVTAFGANLLQLKPCIQMREGKLEVCKKYRGQINKVYEKYITERLSGKRVRPDYLFVSTADELTEEYKEHLCTLIRSITPIEEIIFNRLGSTVTSHSGPGTLGILFLVE